MLGLPDDARRYDVARDMLAHLGVASVRLMTNNPAKVRALRALGVPVTGRVPVVVAPTRHSASYLEAKRLRMEHDLPALLRAAAERRRVATAGRHGRIVALWYAHRSHATTSASPTPRRKPSSTRRRRIAGLERALARAGHRVEPFDVTGPASLLVTRLEAFAPDIVFNLAEGHRGKTRRAFYPALFEELGIPSTGSDAYTL